jgi:hypothetical protein
LWGSIMLYIDKMKFGDDDENKDDNKAGTANEELTKEMLFSIGKVISSVWILSVVVFFMIYKKEFVQSFVGTATAKTYTKECFDWQMKQKPRVQDEAIVKVSLPSLYLSFILFASLTLSLSLFLPLSLSLFLFVLVKVFKKHPDMYSNFSRELGAFVSENWEKWHHEKPKFFTKKFIASIPFSVLSEAIREEIIGNNLHGEPRRKMSLAEERRKAEVGMKWKHAVARVIRKNYIAGE